MLLLKLLLLLIVMLLLLLQLLLQLPLDIAHHLSNRIVDSRPALITSAALFCIIRHRHEHELGVVGKRSLQEHDAPQTGLNARIFQLLRTLLNQDAQLVK